MVDRVIMTATVVALTGFLTSPAFGEREDLSDSPVLRKLIQKKFEDIKEIRLRLHRWEKSTRGFRRDHNFTFSFSQGVGTWKGTLPSQNSSANAPVPFEIETDRYIVRGGYSFHLQLFRGLGYYLGTQVGVSLLEESDLEGFKPPILYELPGVSLGLVWNISPAIRFSVGGNLHLVRIDRFYYQDSKAQTTARALNRQISLDIFLSISNGIKLEYSEYGLSLDDGNSVAIERIEKSVSIGWVEHLI